MSRILLVGSGSSAMALTVAAMLAAKGHHDVQIITAESDADAERIVNANEGMVNSTRAMEQEVCILGVGGRAFDTVSLQAIERFTFMEPVELRDPQPLEHYRDLRRQSQYHMAQKVKSFSARQKRR